MGAHANGRVPAYAAATGEQLEAIVEMGSELAQTPRRQPGCRQLDRQREPVQASADLVDQGHVRVGRLEGAEHGRGTLAEERRRIGGALLRFETKGMQVEPDLVSQSEYLAARRQYGDPIAV